MQNSPLMAAPSSISYIQAVEDRLRKGRLCGDLCSLGKVEEDYVHAQTLSKAEACTGKMKDEAKAHQVIQLRNQSKVPKAEKAMCEAQCLSLGGHTLGKVKAHRHSW